MSEYPKDPRHPVERAWKAWSRSTFGGIINVVVGLALCVLAGKLFAWAVFL